MILAACDVCIVEASRLSDDVQPYMSLSFRGLLRYVYHYLETNSEMVLYLKQCSQQTLTSNGSLTFLTVRVQCSKVSLVSQHGH